MDENPGLVRRITLPHKTWEGRTVEGVEITTNVNNLGDGKPVFLQMGVHHAREWPSGEHAIEWAYELVNGYKSGDARARRLVGDVRTIVIPVVNPDGFNISREAGEAQGGGDGRGTPNPGEDNETANIVSHPVRVPAQELPPARGRERATAPARRPAWPRRAWTRTATTARSGAARARAATSPTRPTTGPAAFSEPETQNIRDLVSGRQVTTLITNHTFSDLVLRAPGPEVAGARRRTSPR